MSDGAFLLFIHVSTVSFVYPSRILHISFVYPNAVYFSSIFGQWFCVSSFVSSRACHSPSPPVNTPGRKSILFTCGGKYSLSLALSSPALFSFLSFHFYPLFLFRPLFLLFHGGYFSPLVCCFFLLFLFSVATIFFSN